MSDENKTPIDPEEENKNPIPEEIREAMQKFMDKVMNGEFPPDGRVFFIQKPNGDVDMTTDPNEMMRLSREFIGDNQPVQKYVDIPILKGYWTIRVVDIVPNRGDDVATFSLEIFPRICENAETASDVDLYEMMGLIKTPAFLNFVLSSLTHANIWHCDDINMIANVSNDDAYIRVIVPNATSKLPSWIQDIWRSKEDFEITSNTENRVIGDLDFIVNCTKQRHLYEPLVHYDMTATLNSAGRPNFVEYPFDHTVFYAYLIKNLLEDAVRSFYPVNEIGLYMLNHLEQLHTFFNVAILKNTIKVILDVSPGTIILNDGLPRQYEYLGNNRHGIYHKPYDDKPVKQMKNVLNDRYLIMDQISAFNWSSRKQTFPKMVYSSGVRMGQNDIIDVWKSDSIIFNFNVILNGYGVKTSDGENLVDVRQVESVKCKDLVKSYWVPNSNDIRFMRGHTDMKPVAIVNVSLTEMIKLGLKNSDEILRHLITSEDNIISIINNASGFSTRKGKKGNLITESMLLMEDTFRFIVAFATFNN